MHYDRYSYSASVSSETLHGNVSLHLSAVEAPNDECTAFKDVHLISTSWWTLSGGRPFDGSAADRGDNPVLSYAGQNMTFPKKARLSV